MAAPLGGSAEAQRLRKLLTIEANALKILVGDEPPEEIFEING